jgi:hypothetical protein
MVKQNKKKPNKKEEILKEETEKEKEKEEAKKEELPDDVKVALKIKKEKPIHDIDYVAELENEDYGTDAL